MAILDDVIGVFFTRMESGKAAFPCGDPGL